MIFDTHAHYDDERLLENLPKTVENMKRNEVCAIITCGTDYKSSEFALKLTNGEASGTSLPSASVQ